jgi:alkylated DNA repair dioxygenase AlkB
MQQLGLFSEGGDGHRTLVNDETGTIVYTPGVLEGELAAAWFTTLRATLEWRHERRPMYDRVVDVPRLTAFFEIDADLPPPLLAAKALVESFARRRFNSVGLNLYRDGNDSVAMHNDHTEELVMHSPVALLSLGGTRRMRIHSKARPRRTFDIDLEAGSVLMMAGAAQEHWEHGIPKTRALVAPRISLAFRQRPVPQ